MKRTLILTNLLLIGLLALAGWTLQRRKAEALTHEAQVLKAFPRVPPPPAIRPDAPPKPVSPQDYASDTVQKFLFSKDRNPNVIVKPPPPPPPEPPMPALPAAYGLLMLGEPTILLSSGTTPQRGYHAGDTVGPFKLISFDTKRVTLEWNGKTIEKPITDLAANQSNGTPAAAAPAGPAAPAAPKEAAKQGVPGPEIGNVGWRACVDGDDSPAGTVSDDGYKKVISRNPFGVVCRWTK